MYQNHLVNFSLFFRFVEVGFLTVLWIISVLTKRCKRFRNHAYLNLDRVFLSHLFICGVSGVFPNKDPMT